MIGIEDAKVLTATEWKEQYPIHPSIKIEAIEEIFKAGTLVRKQFNGVFYLIPLFTRTSTPERAEVSIKSLSEKYILEGKYIHPNSIMAEMTKGCSQILDDNQND